MSRSNRRTRSDAGVSRKPYKRQNARQSDMFTVTIKVPEYLNNQLVAFFTTHVMATSPQFACHKARTAFRHHVRLLRPDAAPVHKQDMLIVTVFRGEHWNINPEVKCIYGQPIR